MDTLTLAGNTPVLYFDPADDALDGKGYNVLLANSGAAERFAKADQAFAAFKELLITNLYGGQRS